MKSEDPRLEVIYPHAGSMRAKAPITWQYGWSESHGRCAVE